MKTVRISCILLFLPLLSLAQGPADFSDSFRLSAETKKPVLLIFSGSDWCAPCIRFEKNVLSASDFQSYVSENLILVKADFPQRKKLTDEQKKQNEALAEQYNPKGLFPHLVLLNPDHSVAATLLYTNQSVSEFISEIKSHFQTQHSSSNE